MNSKVRILASEVNPLLKSSEIIYLRNFDRIILQIILIMLNQKVQAKFWVIGIKTHFCFINFLLWTYFDRLDLSKYDRKNKIVLWQPLMHRNDRDINPHRSSVNVNKWEIENLFVVEPPRYGSKNSFRIRNRFNTYYSQVWTLPKSCLKQI